MGAGSGGGAGGGGGPGGGNNYNNVGPPNINGLAQSGLFWSPNFSALFPNAPGGQNMQQQGGINQPGFPPGFQGGQNQGGNPNQWFWNPSFGDWMNLDYFQNPKTYGASYGGDATGYQVPGYGGRSNAQPQGYGSAAGYLGSQGY